MFCKNCGAAIVGRYCSCCGTRVRSELEEYRAAEKKAIREFVRQFYHPLDPNTPLSFMHLATACWYACEISEPNKVTYEVNPDSYVRLNTVKQRATELCERLIAGGF